jgi:lipopolysaccharide/colanic/teichoic acid biosynthesis glycosyltransferase
MFAISNFLVAVLAGVFGLYLSPRLGFEELVNMGLGQISKHAIIVGGWLYTTSKINGFDLRMLIRSKSDFAVNLLVSSVSGIVLSYFTFYIFDYHNIGRWVFVCTLFSYNLLVWGVSLWCLIYRRPKVYVVGNNLTVLKEHLSIGEIGIKNDIFEIVDKDGNSGCVEGFVKCFKKSDLLYIVPCGSGLECVNSECFKKYSGHSCVFTTVSHIIEKELAICNLESIDWCNYWEIPTKVHDFNYSSIRRVFDVLSAILIGITAFPVFLVAMICVKLYDGGPVFYKQVRLGLFGRPFSIIKIRTMSVDAERNGVQWASVGDRRVTSIGRFLRKTRIDEIPQLWNILVGEMSVIGPRPERPEFYRIIASDVPQFKLRLACKPGLTGWAQVNYPYSSSINDSRNKLLYDIYYIKHVDWILDFRILTRTVVAMVKGAR